MRFDAPTLCSDLCASVSIVKSVVTASVQGGSSHWIILRSQQSSSFVDVDVALAVFLYYVQFEDLNRKNRLAELFTKLSL